MPDEFDVEASIERTTGRLLWVYALGAAAMMIHLTPEDAGLLWFAAFVVVYFPLTNAAANRSNPLNHPAIDPWLVRLESVLPGDLTGRRRTD